MVEIETDCLLLRTVQLNDLTIGWQNLNPLSHPNATLAPQARQGRTSGENLNYETLATQARQAKQSGEILNYLLSRYSDILSRIIDTTTCVMSK